VPGHPAIGTRTGDCYVNAGNNHRPAAHRRTRDELLGRDVWSQLNHYLLLITIDIGEACIDQELSALLPPGSQVSVAGVFDPVQEWPEPRPA
jgi:hypothetical protein